MSFTGTFGLNRFLRTAKVHGMFFKDGNFVAQLIFILVIFIFYIFFSEGKHSQTCFARVHSSKVALNKI